MNKPIKFTPRSLDSMKKRGTNEAEVIQAINGSSWRSAKVGRLECDKSYPYKNYWNGKYYEIKQLMPVFKEEDDYMVIITAYVFYF